MKEVNFFWRGSDLSDIELLSLHSFLKKGYNPVLWLFEDIEVPGGVTVKPAYEIIESSLTTDHRNMADIFRYLLLYKYGGWWSDLDNIIINELPSTEYFFPKLESTVNNNLIKCPKNASVLKDIIEAIDLSTVRAAETGKFNFFFIETIIKNHQLEDYIFGNVMSFTPATVWEMSQKIIDWEKYNGQIAIHLFKSALKHSLVNTSMFRENFKNLKNYIG